MSQPEGSALRMGWKPQETVLLENALREAAHTGTPLSAVFRRVAVHTGRKANSVRNYYYTVMRGQVIREEEELVRREPGAFTPFTREESRWLLREVLTGKARGESVRAVTLRLGEQDRARGLRYQNKYRSLLRTHPGEVREALRELRAEGVPCADPYAAGEPDWELPEREELDALLPEGIDRLRQNGQEDIRAMVQGIRGLLTLAVAGEVANHRLEQTRRELQEGTEAWEQQKTRLRAMARELRPGITAGTPDTPRLLSLLDSLEEL